MAIITFGTGGTHADIGAAYTAAAPGDTLIGYGPKTESNVALTIAKANLTILFERGPYIFEGGLVTAGCFDVTGNGVTIDGGALKLLKITRYTAYAVRMSGQGQTLRRAEIYSCGVIGTALEHVFLSSSQESEVDSCLIRDSNDNQTLLMGVWCFGTTRAPYIHGCEIRGLSNTVAGDCCGIAMSVQARAARVTDNRIYTLTSGAAWCCGILGDGPSATQNQTHRFERNRVYSLTGATSCYGIACAQGSYEVNCNLVHTLTAPVGAGVGILHASVDADPLHAYSTCYHNTVVGVRKGIWLFNGGGAAVRLQAANNIVQGCTEDGYRHNGAAILNSQYNTANDNATNWNGWATGTGDWTDVDPELQASLEYAPRAPTETTIPSTAIDSGTVIDGVDYDLDGDPRRTGYGVDRGCHEYQWPPYHYPTAVNVLLPSQYRDGLYLLALIAAMLGNANAEGRTPTFSGLEELEETFRDLIRKRWLANAVGAQLDGIGAVLNITRTADDDDVWRQALYIRAAQIMCSGTTEEIIAVIKMLFPDAVYVQVQDEYPAKIRVFVQSPGWVETSKITDWLQTLPLAGVGIWFSHAYSLPFGYGEVDAAHVVTPNVHADHFAEVDAAHNLIGAGGVWTEIYKHSWEA